MGASSETMQANFEVCKRYVVAAVEARNATKHASLRYVYAAWLLPWLSWDPRSEFWWDSNEDVAQRSGRCYKMLGVHNA